jgi:hypothetical protein
MLAIVCGLTGCVLIKARRVKQHLGRGKLLVDMAVAPLTKSPTAQWTLEDLEHGNRCVHQASACFIEARAELRLGRPLLRLAGGDARALPHLIDLLIDATNAGQELITGLQPLASMLLATPEAPDLAHFDVNEWLLEPLAAGQPHLLKAREHLTAALAASERIDRTLLSDELAFEVDKIDRWLPRLHQTTRALVDLPELLSSLLGLEGRRVYLVLAQNNDELRPTGGWIGSYGLLVVEGGRIVESAFRSTYPPHLQPPEEECPVESPPWWLQLRKPVWACWDAHWTADFPTLARDAEWFYERGGNPHAPVDGVIGIDLLAVEQLLAVLGPVEVVGYGEEVRAESLRSLIYSHYRYPARFKAEHKLFLTSLSNAIVDRLDALSSEEVWALLRALWATVEERHVLLYFNDPELAELAAELGADGGILPEAGDYLFVVDSSLRSKAYSSIAETIDYKVSIRPGGSIIGKVSVEWRFPADAVGSDPALAYRDWAQEGRSPDLVNLSRVYLPGDSVWIASDGGNGPVQLAEEAGKLMLGSLVNVPLGESRLIRHQYLIPDMVQCLGERSYYRLLVQKQAGTQGHRLQVRIRLPKGARLLSTRPQASQVVEADGETTVELRARLARDRRFEVVFRSPQQSDS